MCGIAGIVRLDGPGPASVDLLARMAGAIAYRGPDGSGIYVDDRAGLAQTRLSIIDLPGGAQPIHNEDETLWIVYNGEVFNYPELREGLAGRGHRFYTATDTEVILHLYEDNGTDCLRYLNGQFALAIWDAAKKTLFLARDRIGIRPLHYHVGSGCIRFASEIKALFQDPEIPRRIDPVSLDQVFTFWSTLPGRTFFQGIHELPPGHFLVAKDGRVRVEKYWELPISLPGTGPNVADEEIQARCAELLVDAVRIRLRADVPVGCYVSGGLDSSVIAAIVRRHFNNRLRTFGIGFQEAGYDEQRYQDTMVRHLGTDHTGIRAGNVDIGRRFAEVVRHCETPILRTAPVPMFFLSGAVRDAGFKVVLTGEGADEFFGGYDIFREALVRAFWARRPSSRLRPLLIEKLHPYLFNDPRLKGTLRAFFAKGIDNPGDPFFSHRIRWENTARIKTFFSGEIRSAVGDYDGLQELEGRLPAAFRDADPLSRAQYLETLIFLSKYLLSSQGDRVAMGHSVEIRLPYLDFRLMEILARVPARLKVSGLQEKVLLKKIAADLIPREILRRPKQPYRAPIRESLLPAGEPAPAPLSPASVRDAGLFDPAKVEGLLKKMRRLAQASEVDGMAVAGILSAQIVHREFIESFSPANPVAPGLFIDRREGAAKSS